MGKQYTELSSTHIDFIKKQKMFFVATADTDGYVNLSPKGGDSLRIINENKLVWLNITGSGNESATHIQNNPRMTVMFNAFEGDPMILRVYANAKVIHKKDKNYNELYKLFDPNKNKAILNATRQIFELDIKMVQISCGFSVPLYEYVKNRDEMDDWAEKKGKEGIEKYWADKNQISLDGKKTNILEKNIFTK